MSTSEAEPAHASGVQRLVMAVFFLQPIAFGAWLPRIPEMQVKLGLGPAALAFTLLGLPVGTLLTLPFAGRFVAHIGSRATILYGFIVFLAVVSLPTMASAPWHMFAALLALGVAMATLELGLNVEADQLEKSAGVMIMNTCHGCWSLGIMAGSLVGSALAGLAIPPTLAVASTALCTLPFALVSARALPVYRAEADAAAAKARWKPPGAALLGICFFVFGVTMTEGAIADWSAIYLRDVFAAPAGSAGIGYAVFAGMVAAGRFAGDRLKARFGAVTTARLCGSLSLIGILAVVAAPAPWVAFAGFAATGFGVSVGFPLAVSAAASLTDRPTAASVAILSFIALFGFLIGPPLIGFVAQTTGMRYGLAALLPVLALSLGMTRMLATRR